MPGSSPTAAMAGEQMGGDRVLARLERIPVSWWHVRARIILGSATFFDAFDLLAISFALPVLAGEWQLSPQQIGLLLASTFAGQLVGALVSGWFAERYGRIFVANITIGIFATMSLACAFAWGPGSMMAFRFLQGVGLGGEVPVATTYITELARAEGRGRFYLLYEMVFSVGILAAGLIGVLLVPNFGWQSMFYIGSIPGLLVFFLRRLLPESPRWLLSRGRVADADAVVSGIENFVTARGVALPPVRQISNVVVVQAASRLAELFEGRYLRRTLTMWAMWFCAFSTGYGLNTWLPTLFRTVFKLPLTQSLNYGLITGVAGLVGTALCALTVDKIGRRTWLTAGLLCGGATLLVIWAIGPSTAGVLLALVCLTGFFISGVAQTLNLYTPELYPTRMRAAGACIGGAWQRVAAVLGPIVVGALLPAFGLGSVFVYFGGIAVLGGVIAFLWATETKGRVLEELSP